MIDGLSIAFVVVMCILAYMFGYYDGYADGSNGFFNKFTFRF